MNPRRAKAAGHIAIVIVIAEHGERSLDGGRQRREQLRDRFDEPAIAVGHVIAAKDDEVGFRAREQRHRTAHVLGRHRRAVMNVGQEADAEAIHRRRQSGHRNILLDADETMSLVRGSVCERRADGANPGREKRA